MLLLISAFIAGILTVLAPCVLPLLPVIIGGSMAGNAQDKRRPLLIAASLAVSLVLFTLLLKVTTIFIAVPPVVFTYISGGIIIAIGLASLFPKIYATIIGTLGIEQRALRLLGNGTRSKNQWIGPVITGAALGPVFSSCSPVYGYILATVLPANFAAAMAYIISYVYPKETTSRFLALAVELDQMHLSTNELSQSLFVVSDVLKEAMDVCFEFFECFSSLCANDVLLHEMP